MEERLQKILAKAGVASRRTAESIILAGRVTVDGKVVTAMGTKVDPERCRIALDGTPLAMAEEKISLLLNKPTGYVTTLKDPQGRPVVTDLLKDITARIFPVGRLDLDTEGALILTNDGELAQRILHPSKEIKKTYIARVAGYPDKKTITKLEQGIELEGRKTWPAQLRIIKKSTRDTTVEIIIHEGRKRQVRKMFAAMSHKVLALKRIAYGNLKLGTLPPGKYRILSKQDLARIFS